MTAAVSRAVVIGYGAIGSRHARLLRELGLAVTVVSRRPVAGFPQASLSDAVAADPGAYAVVASDTARHAEDLRSLATARHHGPLLVEKPLVASADDRVEGRWANAAVGFDLRFNPLLTSLRRRLAARTVFAVEAAAGQYLPDWRPGQDHRRSCSADTARGGGVLRDLCHEIDYLLWLFGPWRRVAALSGNTGSLQIDSEDHVSVLAAGDNGLAVTLTLDYLDRPLRRYCRAQHDGGTTVLDFAAGTISENGVVVEEARNLGESAFVAEHRALLAGGLAADPDSPLCDFAQAWKVQRAIAAVEQAARDGRWVEIQMP